MNRIFICCLVLVLLLCSCREHQPTNIPAPDPAVETFTFDQLFTELTLDIAGSPWLRSIEYKSSADPLSSMLQVVNSIYRFTHDTLDLVYTDLPNLGAFVIDRKDQVWAIAATALIRITETGVDTVYDDGGLINTILVDIHNNIWITPAGTGMVKISENGHEIYDVENSGVLSNNVTCSSIDQSNTKWFGHISTGISRISDNGLVDIIPDFIDQNLYILAPGNSSNMLAGLGWYNNDTILVNIGYGPPVNLSPVIDNAVFPQVRLLVTDIAVDHFSRIWTVISHVEKQSTVKKELYYHNMEWQKLELLPDEDYIVSIKADRRNAIFYALSNRTLYRIR